MGMEKFCQSCMIPRDHQKFEKGTEKDGSTNADYCKYCYENGDFTQPEIQTAKDMQAFVKYRLKEQGYGHFKCWWYSLFIPNLKRWTK